MIQFFVPSMTHASPSRTARVRLPPASDPASGSDSGIDLPTVGLILMIVGAVGAILSVIWMFYGSRRNATVTTTDRRDVYNRDVYN